MDIVSHALWGGGLFGQNKKENGKKVFWIAFIIGMIPDLLAFSLPFISRFIAAISGDGEFYGKPELASIPDYVHTLYNIGHSLLIFGTIFCLVWFFRKRPYIPLLAWGFHIFIDIFTHSKEFFPTPFLWPVSEYRFDGISWGTPVIFLSNVVALVVLYVFILIKNKRKWLN